MDRAPALAVTLAVGAFISVQPVANAKLGRHVGDLGAAFTSLAVSTLIVGLVMVAAGDVGQWRDGLGEIRPVHLLGALSGAAIVAVSLIAVRPLGAGTLTAALVATQLIAAVVLDRLGVLGLDRVDLDAKRVAGIALLLAGTWLVTSS